MKEKQHWNLFFWGFLSCFPNNSKLLESLPFSVIGINKALRGIRIETNFIKDVKATSHTNKDFVYQRVVVWKEWRLSNKQLDFSELPVRTSNFQLQSGSLEAPLEAFTESTKLQFYTFQLPPLSSWVQSRFWTLSKICQFPHSGYLC